MSLICDIGRKRAKSPFENGLENIHTLYFVPIRANTKCTLVNESDVDFDFDFDSGYPELQLKPLSSVEGLLFEKNMKTCSLKTD
jgi:hypothetical protein